MNLSDVYEQNKEKLVKSGWKIKEKYSKNGIEKFRRLTANKNNINVRIDESTDRIQVYIYNLNGGCKYFTSYWNYDSMIDSVSLIMKERNICVVKSDLPPPFELRSDLSHFLLLDSGNQCNIKIWAQSVTFIKYGSIGRTLEFIEDEITDDLWFLVMCTACGPEKRYFIATNGDDKYYPVIQIDGKFRIWPEAPGSNPTIDYPNFRLTNTEVEMIKSVCLSAARRMMR